ncbi:MAG: ribonuclease H-like domain-containing protein [Patescibacteria group bacterium]|nr:ribonuclease H-like domain-containing protein [Patescibacteria group bacterium]
MERKIKPRILAIDIETFPIRGFSWGLYEQNILWVDKPSIICGFSAKWLGGKQTTKTLIDYPHNPANWSDTHIVKELWKFFDKADIIIAQNGDNFDIKMINTEFIKHGLPPPSPYKTVDTLKSARRVFKFPSNKLDDLGAQLKVGRKIEHEGKGLWRKCMENDRKAWIEMKKYNAQDVILLEKVYQKFLPWMVNSPLRHFMSKQSYSCPNCGSSHSHRKGYEWGNGKKYLRMHCMDCGAWGKDYKAIK